MRWLFPLLLVFGSAAHAERRFLLAIGENRGEAGQEQLRYAEADARAFRRVMVELGNVEPQDARALLGATADDVRRALAELGERLVQTGAGAEDSLFVYVSSHAADGALLLRGSSLPLAELRAFVEGAPVGMAMVVLDTCHAAWITRAKGLEPLTDRTVTFEKPMVTGRVYIASAGPMEPAQESDRLGGSYFTHHLLAGLRGVADHSGDGRITLWEAFTYAHAHTQAATLGSRGGRQTPIYEVALEGEREVVLTDLARGRALLTLATHRPADWVVVNLDGDRRSARFSSTGPMVFSVDPGTYLIRTSTGSGAFEHQLTLEDGAMVTLDESDLAEWSPAEGRTKGGPMLALSIGAQVGTATVDGTDAVLPGLVVGVERALRGRLAAGLQLGFRLGEATHDGTRFSHDELDLAAQLTWLQPFGAWALRFGGAIGGVVVHQAGTPLGDVTAFQPRLGALAGARVPFGEGAFVDLGATAGGQSVSVDDEHRFTPFLLAALAIGMGF